jgi:hypothetical protein
LTVDLNKYKDFVEQVTSKESNQLSEMFYRAKDLEANNPELKTALLLTGAIGIALIVAGHWISILMRS